MEQILLGLVVFNAFFKPSDLKYDTFEIAHIDFNANKKTKLQYNDEFSKISGTSLGSREYNQVSSWFRYGHATYIYGQKSESEKGLRKLKQLY